LYVNNGIPNHSSQYCLCRKCGRCPDDFAKLAFEDIDDAVVGNPHRNLSFVIVRSNATDFPVFNLEHFGDYTVEVAGLTGDEHLAVFDREEDHDHGFHNITGLTIHLIDEHVQFPSLFLRDIQFVCDFETCVLNSSQLNIDYDSMRNASRAGVFLAPPINGVELETVGYLPAVDIVLYGSRKLGVNKVNITTNALTKPEILVNVADTANLFLGPLVYDAPSVSMIPPLRIRARGGPTFVACGGEGWPIEVSDLTSKIVVEHGDRPLYLRAQEGHHGPRQPAIVAHEGGGVVFINDLASNFHPAYCVCDAPNCTDDCGEFGPVIDVDEDTIANTVKRNPARVIEYHCFIWDRRKRAVFNLADFTRHSIEVVGGFVKLLTTHRQEPPSSSVTHTFRNVNVRFGSSGVYTFNHVVFDNVTFVRSAAVVDGGIEVLQRDLTADLVSLQELKRTNLLAPASGSLVIMGEGDVSRVHVKGSHELEVQAENGGEPVSVDLSRLRSAAVVKATRGTSGDPFVVAWEGTLSDFGMLPPALRIDLSGVQAEDVYVKFTGPNWKFHVNLTGFITVAHGQANVHIEADQNEHGVYALVPPVVDLEGDGDLYVNGRKIAHSVLIAPGQDVILGSDETNYLAFFVITLAALGMVALLFLVFPRSKAAPLPAVRREDQLDHGGEAFPTTDEVEPQDQV
jgi:hypothetical protein